jgi:hypothetical protein
VSKRNHKHKLASKQTPQVLFNKKAKRRMRDICRTLILLAVIVPLTGFGFYEFKKNYDISHDLSVIGQGVPTVVQIHDPKCQLCLQLRRNANSAIARIAGDDLLFRVADVTTHEGRRLQRKHKVPNVTLLLFDRDGKLNRSLNGVKGDDVLHQAFLAHINRKANRVRTVQPDA